MLQSMKKPFHKFLNWLMLPQFVKKVQRILKIITDQSPLKNLSKIFLKKYVQTDGCIILMDKYFSKFQSSL